MQVTSRGSDGMREAMRRIPMKKLFASIAAVAVVASMSVPAAAFPDRPVRIIVPFAAGGVTDLAARLVGQQLSAKWNQSVVIENRPGAGGLIGVDAVIRSPADGYTLLMSSNGELVNHPALSAKPRFNPLTDLIPITMVTSTPYAWLAHVDSGIQSLADLVKTAKAKPGSLSFPSAGVGSTMHLATQQFITAAGLDLLHIPYRGGAPAATALTTGEVPVGLVALSAVPPVVDSGRTRLLAVTSVARSKMLPNAPTVAETGVLSSFQAAVWTALFAPKGTPDGIVAKVRTDALEALKDPATLEKLAAVGTDPGDVSGAELAARIRKEIEETSRLGKTAKIELD
jgi:tripartite-type tricarboxylate transporter receptor subunit TctC